MTPTQHHAFEKLLRTWNERHELQTHGAPLSSMVEARRRLDDARREMARASH